MIVSVTIQRSNPKVLRELYVKDDKPFSYLLKVIEKCFGWSEGSMNGGYQVEINGRVQKNLENELCCNILPAQSDLPLIIRKEMALDPYRDWSRKAEPSDQWIIFIHREREEEYEMIDVDRDALLIRATGLHPLEECSSMKNHNRIQVALLQEGSYYSPQQGRINIYAKKVNIHQINQQLSHLSGEKKKSQQVKIDYSQCGGLETIIASYRVDEIKRTVTSKRFAVDYKLKKAELVIALARHYDKAGFWETVLQEMPLEEYYLLKRLCLGQAIAFRDTKASMPTLESYCLVEYQSFDFPLVPRPLADYLGYYLEGVGDQDLIQSKKMRTVMKLAAILYGVFDLDSCTRLAQVMFLEDSEDFDFQEVWTPSREWDMLDQVHMYDNKVFYRGDAISLLSTQKKNRMEPYIPTKEQAFEILERGLTYEKKDRQELKQALSKLKSRYQFAHIEDVVLDEIYKMCRIGRSKYDIQYFMENTCAYYGNQRYMDHFLEIMESLRSHIRLYELQGHTAEEGIVFK